MTQRYGIMVVDDDADACDVIGSALKQAGYAVETARDGAEAIAKMAQFPAHVVLTDLQMPGMNGLELIREVRQLGGKAPFLIMTGAETRDLCTSAEKYGAVDCLAKPVNLDELIWAIDSAIALQRRSGVLPNATVSASAAV